MTVGQHKQMKNNYTLSFTLTLFNSLKPSKVSCWDT